MKDILKSQNSDQQQLLRWYKQNRSRNESEELKKIQSQKIVPVWPEYKCDTLYTQIFRTTLENQSNTQIILIDRILEKLDEIDFKIVRKNDDEYNFNYNGYLYNSPSHKNVVCWRPNTNENQNKSTFSFDQSEEKEREKIFPTKNNFQVVACNDKSSTLPVLNSFLSKLNSNNSNPSKQPAKKTMNLPQV